MAVNALEVEVARSIRHFDFHGGKLHVVRDRRGNPAVRGPYDFRFSSQGVTVGLEAKMIRGYRSFPFARVEPHQEEGLLHLERRGGGLGYVLLGFRVPRKSRCFALRVGDWRDLRAALARNPGRKSVPFALVTERFTEIPRLRLDQGTGWDLRVLLPG